MRAHAIMHLHSLLLGLGLGHDFVLERKGYLLEHIWGTLNVTIMGENF